MTERKWTGGEWVAYDFAGDWWIATMDNDSGPIFKINGPTRDRAANAHLIAAAPDLYEALENLLEACEKFGITGGNIDIAYKTLAKARGG